MSRRSIIRVEVWRGGAGGRNKHYMYVTGTTCLLTDAFPTSLRSFFKVPNFHTCEVAYTSLAKKRCHCLVEPPTWSGCLMLCCECQYTNCSVCIRKIHKHTLCIGRLACRNNRKTSFLLNGQFTYLPIHHPPSNASPHGSEIVACHFSSSSLRPAEDHADSPVFCLPSV